MRLWGYAFAIALLSNAAWAGGPSAADVATGRELYKQGADALDQNKPNVAVDKLSQAWALVQTPVIGYDLARAHVALGHLVEAREAALAVQRLAVASGETARSTEARNEATKLAAQLEPRIPHVSIAIDGLAGHEATVKLDGNVVPTAALAVARQANPGPHVATVETDDGRKGEGSVTLGENETKSISIKLGAPSADAPPPKPPQDNNKPIAVVTTPPPADTSKTEKGGLSPLVWVGVGTIGVGAIVGTITGAMSLSEAATVKQNCTTTIGDKTICRPPYTDNLSNASTFSTVSTIAFVVAAVGIPIVITGFVLSGKSKSTAARIAPYVGPMSGIRGEF